MIDSQSSYYIDTVYGRINYYKFGSGAKIMLCFHGFGQDGMVMKPLANVLEHEYTFYCFDLFYHGRTFWASKEHAVEKAFWVEALSGFLKEKNIATFSVTAFSLGGKLALVTADYFHDRIEKILLLAPDGIKTQMWYNLATYPGVFQKYFKSIIVKPHRFHRIVNTLKKTNLVDKGILKFANTQMNSIKKRRQVYYSWMAFKKLTTDLTLVSEKINMADIPVEMYLGKYDKIITREGMRVLTDKLNRIEVTLLECGHNTLINHTASHLKKHSG